MDQDNELRRVAARRARDQQRLNNLNSSKSRSISFAKDENKALIMEKRRLKKKQMREAKEEAARNEAVSNLVAQMEMQQQTEKEIAKQALALEWKSQRLLRSKQDPDWDIHDPERLRLERPPRKDDEGTGLGASSMQMFAGEDLKSAERKRIMQNNLSIDLHRQMAAQQRQKQQQNRATAEYDEQQRLMCKQVLQIEQEETDRRCRDVRNTAEYNRSLKYNRKNTVRSSDADALSQLESQFFKRSGSTSKRSDMYKGMSSAERRDIYAEQARQRVELDRRRQQERDYESKFAENEKATLEMLDEMSLRKMQEKDAVVKEHQLDILMQQRGRRRMDQIKLANEKKNGYKPEYFAKFNASAR